MKRAKQAAVQQVAKTFFFLVILIVSGLIAGGCALPTNGTDDDPEGVDTMSNQPTKMVKGPDGWSANGVLHTLLYNEIVNCQADFPESGNYSVEFSVSPTNPGDGSTIAQTEALITWSVEGNNVTRRLTITNGATISGVAQAVKIRVFDVTPFAGTPKGVPYTVSIQAVRGIRADSQLPPILLPHPFVDDLAAVPVTQPFEQGNYLVTANPVPGGAGNGSITIPIPTDAGVVSALVLVSPTVPTAGYQAQGTAPVVPDDMLLVVTGNTGTTEFSSYDPRKFPGWIPIAPGANRMTLFNAMPIGQPPVTYTVFLGIDG